MPWRAWIRHNRASWVVLRMNGKARLENRLSSKKAVQVSQRRVGTPIKDNVVAVLL
jgi:hypothetical protein